MRITSFGGAIALVLIAGCADEPALEPPLTRLDLRQAMSTTSATLVGVAVSPDGERFVLDRALGLYQITGTAAVAIVPMSALPDPGTPIELPFTDLVSISPGVFALTAIGDGFLLDTSAMTLTQRFCYEPGGLPEEMDQHTDAIAYDPELDRLYAQPLTFDGEDVFQLSQLASYDRATGTSIEWHDVGDTVAATGMAVIPNVGLVLGQGSRLARFDRATGSMVELADLRRFGVRSIDGLAVDRATGTLLVVDDTTDELVEIELARITGE